MTTRRKFLAWLGLAPVALPAAIKAGPAPVNPFAGKLQCISDEAITRLTPEEFMALWRGSILGIRVRLDSEMIARGGMAIRYEDITADLRHADYSALRDAVTVKRRVDDGFPRT